MSPRSFIDAGYALIVNEFLRIPGAEVARIREWSAKWTRP